MEYIIGAVIGYLFGCLNTAKIISALRGVDIKNIGTNNAGASNVFMTVGKAYGVIVAVLDILKSFLAAEIVFIVFGGNFTASVIAGVMAVVGHIFPFWMKFSGGKGLAPFMGMVLFYDWKLFLIFVALIAAIVLIVDFISVGALTVTVLLPIHCAVFVHDYIAAAVLGVLCVLMWYKHKDNIKRLASGTEIGFRRKNVYKK